MSDLVADLLREVFEYRRRTGMTLSRMGSLIGGDQKLLKQIADGTRQPLPHTIARIRNFMAENPDGVPRKRRAVSEISP